MRLRSLLCHLLSVGAFLIAILGRDLAADAGGALCGAARSVVGGPLATLRCVLDPPKHLFELSATVPRLGRFGCAGFGEALFQSAGELAQIVIRHA